MMLSWRSPDGTVTSFDDLVDGVLVEDGVEGRFGVPSVYSREVVPFQAGSRLRQARHGEREVAVPVGIVSNNLRDTLRLLAKRLSTVKGDGALIAFDGVTSRELPCRFNGSLQVLEDVRSRHVGFTTTVLVFEAFDPFWRDTADTQLVYDLGEETQPFFPFPPLLLGGGAIFVSPTVDNTGDVDAFPVWTIQGPGGPIILTNVTTGETLGIDTTLVSPSQRVIVDTRPFRKSIVREDGTNLYGQRTPGSSLWSLAPGPNIIQVSLAGATVDSEVRLSFRRRWLSA